MKLRVLLPFRVFLEKNNIRRLVVETSQGFLGIWPNRLDFATELVPGLLMYQAESEGEAWLAVDEGIIVKSGGDVLVSVRNAVGDADLGRLRQKISGEFERIDEKEDETRAVLAKLESGFVRRLAEVQRG